MNPFFSIITPVFNGAEFVFPYVQCLKSQQFSSWEALIVDDGSSDGTLDLLIKMVEGDSRFRVFSPSLLKSWPGPYAARNFAMSRSKGSYVCFLDIDDLWLPSHLSSFRSIIADNPGVKILTGAYFRKSLISGDINVRYPSVFSPFSLWINVINPLPLLATALSCDLAKTVRFPPCGHEDYIFWFLALRAIDESLIHAHLCPTSVYLVRPSSVSSNKFRAVMWIFNCYRYFNRSFIVAFFLVFLRGLILLLSPVLYSLRLPGLLIRFGL